MTAARHFITLETTDMNSLEIRALDYDAKTIGMLAALLVETVAAGGSVSFMHPLSADAAHEFWRKSLAAAARGERALLGAWDGGALVGTVTLLLDCPPNQPHRAEIAKLMIRLDCRGKGVATRLMLAASNGDFLIHPDASHTFGSDLGLPWRYVAANPSGHEDLDLEHVAKFPLAPGVPRELTAVLTVPANEWLKLLTAARNKAANETSSSATGLVGAVGS